VLVFSGEMIAAVASGFLLAFSFPPFDQAWICWFALVPLLFVIRGKNCKKAFFLSFLCGVTFFVCLFHWILNLEGYTLLHHFLLAIYLGSYFGIFGVAFAYLSRRFDLFPILFFIPFIWVTLEFVRSNLSFLALPWGLLAHSQYKSLTLIQVATITGAYGISFLIIMINCVIAALIQAKISSRKNSISLGSRYHAKRHRIVIICSVVVILLFSLLYGHFKIKKSFSGPELKVAVIQGNIDQNMKWDPRNAGHIMETYRDLSLKASQSVPDMIIWPEAATPRAINRDPGLLRKINRIAGESGAYLLIGSTQTQKFSRNHSAGHSRYLNSAYLIPPPGHKIIGGNRYDKIRLLPFGEYIPLKNWIKWSYINVPPFDDYEAGTDVKIFRTPDCSFGVTICWENIFPDLVRELVQEGAQFIINIANEAWFGRSAAPNQFLSMSVFRAVENGVFVIRCVNTGISCIIDPRGRIVSRVKDREGKDTFVPGITVGPIIPAQSGTFYTRYGDWLAGLSIASSCGILLMTLFQSRRNRIIMLRNIKAWKRAI
jgi:apolipoprotein N-acyltransferase